MLVWYGDGVNFISGRVFLLGMIVAAICAIIGLIWGIKGLKSTRKRLAIAGITVCTISLPFWMYNFLVWLTIGGLTDL